MSGTEPNNSPNESTASDISFFASGSIGSKDSSVKGTSVFGGDLVVSGALTLGAPDKGQDFTAYNSSLTKLGIRWRPNEAENGSLILGDHARGVDFMVHGSSAGKFMMWNQDINKLAVNGQFVTTAGDVIINDLGDDFDFRVETNNKAGAILVDGGTDQVGILAKGTTAANAYSDDTNGTLRALPDDVGLFISGTIGGRDVTTGDLAKGTSVIGGDLVVSGSIVSLSEQSITIGSGADAFKISAVSGVATLESDNLRLKGVTGQQSLDMRPDKVLILSGGAAGSIDESQYPDVNFFVSGSTGSKNTSFKGTSLFGGDLVVSGTSHFKTGLSGSLTRLADGTSFLVAGLGMSVVTGSSGQVTLSVTSTTPRVKTVYAVTASHASGTPLVVNGAQISNSEYDPGRSDIYVNGQLMTSGSTRDYTLAGDNTGLNFNFTLEVDDMITVLIT